MKIGRILKVIGIVVLAIIVLAAVGLFAWSKLGTYPAGDVAASALISTDSVEIEEDQWIVFEPLEATDTGLIFYPGGLVAPSAYAPILHQIAESGVLVVIMPMPLNLAIFNTSAANEVIDSYAQISTWLIAGHSLGGTAAAIFAENNPAAMDALALWDSYPAGSSNLSDNNLPVISIFGTMNGSPNTDNLNENRVLLPPNTAFVGIEGANHAQFGDYGPQRGDVVASISLAEQHNQVTAIMLDFIDMIR